MQIIRILVFMVIPFIVGFILADIAFSKTATFSCVPPTERFDGANLPAAEIQEYELLKDGAAVSNADTCKWILKNITSDNNGSYTAVAIDTGGQRSVPSDPFPLALDKMKPKSPTQLGAEISE